MHREQITLVEDCEARRDRLDDWQHTFVASMRVQLEAGAILTLKQEEKLDEIWERATARG